MSTSALEQRGIPAGFLASTLPSDGALRWYAVHVPAGREESVASKCRQLVSPEILQDCFVPKYEKYMKMQGAWRLMIDPMFSEYLFVSTRNVRALAKELAKLSFPVELAGKSGSSCKPLSPEVQAWLEQALDAQRVLRASEGFIEGGVLKVEHGPLRGREACVRKINRHKRMAFIRFDEAGGQEFLLRAALNVPRKD